MLFPLISALSVNRRFLRIRITLIRTYVAIPINVVVNMTLWMFSGLVSLRLLLFRTLTPGPGSNPKAVL